MDARGCAPARGAPGKYVEGTLIAVLLVFDAALGFLQESRAQTTLAALKSRLAPNASVRRGGVWKIVPTIGLMPGDIVKLQTYSGARAAWWGGRSSICRKSAKR